MRAPPRSPSTSFSATRRATRALGAPALTAESIAALYGCDAGTVACNALPAILALKISLPRKIVAGTPGDGDAYGAQQHGPLLRLEL